MKTPQPECKYGYTDTQISEMFKDNGTAFYKWMAGQTFSSCEGWEYSYELGAKVSSGCGPHGFVYYSSDVHRFIRGLPVID